MPSHFQGPKDITQALNAYINLIRASDSVLSRTTPGIEAWGLTMGQFGVLEALLHLGPMCQKSLGEKLLRSGGNITVVVDNLEKRGWVRRERQTDDRRMIVIHLTPRGRHLIARVFPGHAREIAGLIKILTAREQRELRRICGKLGRGIAGERKRESESGSAHRSGGKGEKQ
ncbi:MAG: MarR family winged helix-turn-helix transcriptional regulator [Candidatus Acidiferrales bacterium]